MLSVGLFTYSTKPRGSVVHATHLAEALAARGHDVTLYALSKAGDRLYRELSCPVVYLPAKAAPEQPDRLIAQRIREVYDGVLGVSPRHDVYHAEDCLVASGLLLAREQLELSPLVRTLHHWEHYESAYLRQCQRRSVELADAVACVSCASQRDVERELGRICPIIGNGVDTERFALEAPALSRLARERLRLAPSDEVVLSVGGVEPRKNSWLALEAMVPLLRRHPNLQWLIAGGASIWEHDDYRSRFRARVSELEPETGFRIRELGQVSEHELTDLYRIARILLCPSLQEGFGLCVLEALAARTAVVVSDAEPFTEYLGSDAACFVEPRSVGSIAAAVERLLVDESLCQKRMTEGVELARRFSWSNVAREHERLYERARRDAFSTFPPAREETLHA